MKSIILMGIKHCGKSTQGRLLKEKLNLPFYDIDDLITELNGKSPREIFTQSGEEGFIAAELNACEYLKEKVISSGSAAVIATGGGICNNTKALEILHTLGTFVFLCADEKIAADRIVREIKTDVNGKMTEMPAYIAKKNPHNLEEVRTCFHEFFEQRVKIYSSIADVTVQMGNEPKHINTQQILTELEKLN